MTRWDLKQALIREKLAMRVEARDNATSKGLSGAKLLRFNQELSKKRLDAVVKRLKKTLAEEDRDIVGLDTTQMKAIGASKALTYGVEDIIERRCRISVDVADLKKAIKELFGREFGGRNSTPSLNAARDVPRLLAPILSKTPTLQHEKYVQEEAGRSISIQYRQQET